MNKELLDKKLSVLLDQDVQKEMELRARMGLKLRPELKFYGICSSSKTEPKNSENLPHYLFVTTDEKKANKAREIISDALQSRNQSDDFSQVCERSSQWCELRYSQVQTAH